EPAVRVDQFGIALYPFVDGESFEWGDFSTPEHRHAVLDLVIAVHTAPESVRHQAFADDFGIPGRDEVEKALGERPDPTRDMPECGPYARDTTALLHGNATAVSKELARYDALVAEGRGYPSRAVLTHGEPHRGNTMRTTDGWKLIDWDTALVAPPER